MNIVLYGDSFLGRFGKNQIEQLESRLTNATIYNCSAGGWNSTDLNRRVEYIAKLKAEYVILSFGGNDVAPWKNVVPLESFIDNVKSILSAFNESKILMILCPNVELEDSNQTQEYNDGLASYYGSINSMFEEAGVKIIDTNSLFYGLDNFHESDGVHFNELAYDRIIEKISTLID